MTTTISSTIENDSNKIFITHSDPSTETDLGAENKTLDELRIGKNLFLVLCIFCHLILVINIKIFTI